MDNKNKLLPYLNYLSNLDATVSTVKLLKKNKDHYSFTKFIKSKRPLPILNITDVWNPAQDTSKNIVKNSINVGGLEANRSNNWTKRRRKVHIYKGSNFVHNFITNFDN